MKKIPLRDFQQGAKKYIKKLPVVLTRYNLPVAIVVPYKEPVDLPGAQPGVKKSEWPEHFLGKPLSGKKQKCPICYDSVPVEFANAHRIKKHENM